MRIRVSQSELERLKADLAVCFAFEGDREPRGVGDRTLVRELALQMKAESFRGRAGDRLVWNADGRYASRRFIVLGLGAERPTAGEAIRMGCDRAAREAGRWAARRLAIRLPPIGAGRVDAEVRAAVEGAVLGAYRFDRYLNDPARKPPRLDAIEISSNGPLSASRDAAGRGGIGGRAVCLARDLVNEAPSRMSPTILGRVAAREARTRGLSCKILGGAQLAKMGMSAIAAVSKGSAEPPRVVHLTYKPAGRTRAKERIVLVGKGVTFDSGGLNLKPGNSMLTMKADMAGAAAVLATMTALAELGCKAEVHGVLGLVENMTGGAAYKPGDILDTYSGTTVEIGNTDAEGRLVLCDLLAYAAKTIKPTQVVDVATLTGACVVALGPLAAGLFTRHDALREDLLGAAARAGEKLWPMPMYDEYLQMLQKGPADLRNVGGRWGGAITAALFLGEFLKRDLPWAHLDIAGPAFNDDDLPDLPPGATGASTLTLVRWLEGLG